MIHKVSIKIYCKDLEARRNNITDLKNKLESELQFNTGTI